MKKNKSSISKASSYEQIGNFWDSHDLIDYGGQVKKAKFEVDIKKRRKKEKLQPLKSEES